MFSNVAGVGICSCHFICLKIWKMGNFVGMSGCFGAVVWAPRGLDGEITPPRYGSVIMMNTNVAGVGICGCMTSL